MARIRTIKPELLEDEKVASLPHLAWRLFVSCILLSDDYGNFRAALARIHGAALWNHPREGIAKALERLAIDDLVVFYSVGGQTYGHIAGWEKHQKVDHPGKPLCPGPSDGSRIPRETVANVLESLAPDHDRDPDQGSGSSSVPSPLGSDPDPDRARVATVAPIWAAHEWLTKFKAAWFDRFGRFYGQAADSKACSTLADLLAGFPPAEVLAAQKRSAAMFAEFFSIEKPETVRRGHPFAFFVQEWGALRVDRQPAKPAPVAESFAERDARIKREADQRKSRERAEALRVQRELTEQIEKARTG